MPGLPYEYDANGNITAKQTTQTVSGTSGQSNMELSGHGSDSGLEIYRYDAFNRLSSYNNGAMAASYAYNANNLRSSKTVNNTKTDFVWNGQNLAAESTDSGVNTYTYDMTGIHTTDKNGTVMSYIKDSHGSVIRTADAAGNAMQEAEDRADYDAFGNVYTGSRNTPFGYSGEYVDSESGNIYLRNRYYNSATGRFITEDPAKDGLNWYVYAGNNPVMMIDPSGLDAVVILNTEGAPIADYVPLYDGDWTLGHMAVVVQDYYGDWYYFSLSKDGLVEYSAPRWALNDKENFNYWLSSYWSDYDVATYVTADTAKSYDYYHDAYENGVTYSAFLNNCSQFVVEGLKKATLYDGTKMSRYLGCINSSLPKLAMEEISNRFYNYCWNHDDYIKTINDQLWEAVYGVNKNPAVAKDLEKLYY